MINKYLSKKEQIILRAIDIIDELGIDGLTVRKLAEKQGVTEAALYRHFKSKNDIILEVLDYYSNFDSNIMNTIEKNKLDSKSGLIFFVKSFAEYYENYPEITSVCFSYQSLIYDENLRKKVIEINTNRSVFICNLIEKGKTNREFPSNINSEEIANIIMGTFAGIVFDWRIKKYQFSLKENALSALDTILKFSIL